MAESLYHIRGRHIGPDDLHDIRTMISDHWASGRTAISRLLCEYWDWRQPNGQPKEMGCRALLLALEAKGALELPPRQKESFRAPRRTDRQVFPVDTSPLEGTVGQFRSLTIKMVRRTPDEALWDYLVDHHHYLGRPWIVGSSLKHLVYLDGRLVACLGWGSAAWKVGCRDASIGWDAETRKINLHKVVNNVRFLILPWVRVQHLASKVSYRREKIRKRNLYTTLCRLNFRVPASQPMEASRQVLPSKQLSITLGRRQACIQGVPRCLN